MPQSEQDNNDIDRMESYSASKNYCCRNILFLHFLPTFIVKFIADGIVTELC